MLFNQRLQCFVSRNLSNSVKSICKNETKSSSNGLILKFSTTHSIQKGLGSAGKSSKSKIGGLLKVAGIGFAVGGLASGAYLYNNYRQINQTVLSSLSDDYYVLKELPPKHAIARSIQSPYDKSGLKITLYQFQTCPFCCKVRAFLDYYGFSYDIVEVNSVTHKQTKWSTYKKVPFLIVEIPGTDTILQLKDSSMIISALQSFMLNKSTQLTDLVKGYPVADYIDDSGNKKQEILNQYSISYGEHYKGPSKEEVLLERKWRTWTDKVYVHTLSPNVYRTMAEAFQAFDWFSKVGEWERHFETWERLLVVYVGTLAMYIIGKRLKDRHHLKSDVRLSFYEETNIWLKEIKARGGQFLGGKEPNLADLSVYGVLTAVQGCDAFQDLLRNTKVESWFLNMENAVENKAGAKYLVDRGSCTS